jgi:hypothetical protein
LDAIRSGRCWIAESSAVDLSVTARPSPGGPATVRVAVRGVPAGTVSLHTDAGVVHRDRLADDGTGALERRVDGAFVRAEVRHPGGRMAALSNPVMLA